MMRETPIASTAATRLGQSLRMNAAVAGSTLRSDQASSSTASGSMRTVANDAIAVFRVVLGTMIG